MKLRKSVFVLVVILGCHDARGDWGYQMLVCLLEGKKLRIYLFVFLFFLMKESIKL